MRVRLPDSAYGFVLGEGETTIKEKEFFFVRTFNMFVSINSDDNIEQFITDLKILNFDLHIIYKTCGWINEQFDKKRITLKFEVSRKPLEQLKLFQ